MSNKKRNRWISPKGVAFFPRLNAPDTKFKPEGEYTARLIFDPSDKAVKEFLKKLQTFQKEAFDEHVKENPKHKKYKLAPAYTEETDEDGEATGNVMVNFKMKASGESKSGKKWNRKPTIIDAQKNVLKNPPNIGGGSVLRIGFEPHCSGVAGTKLFYVTCYMDIVQIIELVEFGHANADDYGFEDEDGYEASEDELTDSPDDEDEDADEDDGDEDF